MLEQILIGVGLMIWFWGGVAAYVFRKYVLKRPHTQFEHGMFTGAAAMAVYFFLCVTFFTLKAIFEG